MNAEGMMVAELADAYGLTVEALVARLGALPRPYSGARSVIGSRIIAFMNHRTEPASAGEIARAIGEGRSPQPVRNRLVKMADLGIMRRVSHGRYVLMVKCAGSLAEMAYRSYRRPPFLATIPPWNKLGKTERSRWVEMVKSLSREFAAESDRATAVAS